MATKPKHHPGQASMQPATKRPLRVLAGAIDPWPQPRTGPGNWEEYKGKLLDIGALVRVPWPRASGGPPLPRVLVVSSGIRPSRDEKKMLRCVCHPWGHPERTIHLDAPRAQILSVWVPQQGGRHANQ